MKTMYLLCFPSVLRLYDSAKDAAAARTEEQQSVVMEVYCVEFVHQVLPEKEVA